MVASLPIGTTAQLFATAVYSDGTTADVTQQATWSSSLALTVGVSNLAGSRGLVHAHLPGSATITAAFGGKTGTRVVTSSAALLVSLQVAPATVTVPRGTTTQLHATGIYSDGSSLDVTEQASWTSSAPAVAQVSTSDGSRGRVTGSVDGAATITATLGLAHGAAVVTVSAAALASLAIEPASPSVPRGTTKQLSVFATYSDGSVLDVTASASWSSSTPSVASVSNGALSRGFVLAVAAGTTTVTASLDGTTATTTLTVTPATLLSLEVSVIAALPMGTSLALTATAHYSDGSSSDVTQQAVWTSALPAIVSVTNSGTRGVVTANQLGASTVTATFGAATSFTVVTTSPAQLQQLQISPAALDLPAGSSSQLHATALYSDGSSQDVTQLATWSSDAAAVASVSNTAGQRGALAAHSAGAATITAALGGKTTTLAMTVSAAVLSSLAIEPATVSLPRGTTKQLAAFATFSDGSVLDVTALAAWASDAPLTATVSNLPGSRGLVAGVLAGQTSVNASYGGMSTAAVVSVTPATLLSIELSIVAALPVGTSIALTATAHYSDGSSLDVTQQAVWTSSLPAIASVTSAGTRGVVTAHALGASTITSTFGAATSFTVVATSAAQLQQIQITPGALDLPAGSSSQLHATALYSDGSTQDATQLATWSSDAASVASVSNGLGQRGALTAHAAGAATITASFGGKTATLAMTVSAAMLSSLAIEPFTVSLPRGTTKQLAAFATFSDGSVLDVTALAAWTSDAPLTASVSNLPGSRGLVAGVLAGQTSINASYGGMSTPVAVTVTPAMLTSLEVSIIAALPMGTSLALTATAHYSDGSTLDVTQQASWVSSLPAIVSVTSAGTRGVVTAHTLGASTITATFGAATSFIVVTTSPAQLQQLQISPATLDLPAGTASQLTATALYTDGSTQDVTQLATWSSNAASVASVSNALLQHGALTAHAAGAATITASFGSKTAQLAMTVSAALLSSVAIEPITVSLPRGTTKQLAAFATFSDGSVLDVTALAAWASDAPLTAAVSNLPGSRGLVAGVLAGQTSVTATYGGMAAASSVTVTAAALVSLEVTGTASLPRGLTAPLHCLGHYTDGSTLDLTSQASWSSSAPSVASVANVGVVGLLTANAVGSATVTATIAGQQAQLAITVTAAILDHLRLTPLAINLPRGLVLPVIALGVYSDGSEADLSASVGWSTSAPSVASVSNIVLTAGLVTAINVGDAVITAQIGPISATVTVHVTPAILQSITLAPTISVLSLLQIQLFVATGHYSDGSLLDVTAQASWNTDNSLIALVSNLLGSKGRVLAIGLGPVQVTATLDGVSGGLAIGVGAATCHPVVNEVQTGSLLKNQDEFVEIYNPCAFAVDLTGSRLVYRGAVALTDTTLLDLTGTLDPGAYRLYAGTTYDGGGTVDGTFSVDLSALGGGVGIRRVDTSALVDSVGYGVAANGFVETLSVGVPGLGQSVARKPNGTDTGSNLVDFAIVASPTPRTAN